ncbi:hypothetical protein D3C72_1312720 [compost metagenome]
MQAWPWLWKMAQALPFTAACRLASSNTMLGPLPPSSSCTFFRLPALACTMRRPVAVLPVKAILAISGCSAMYWPATLPRPGSMLTTPGGTPASAISSAMRSDVSGVISAGFITMQLPAASAGAIFQLVNMSGKFHGTTWPTTPTGSRSV